MKKTIIALGMALMAVPMVISCDKEPEEKTVFVSGVSIDKSDMALTEGESATLVAVVLPENATNRNVSWSSGNAAVAAVDDTGKVTAVKAGVATVTVITEEGGKRATCKVTVTAKVIAVTGVSLDRSEMTLVEEETAVLTATVVPYDATNRNVNWSSDNAAVAAVDDTGKITAVKAGVATVTVTTEDGGKTAACKVTVNAKGFDNSDWNSEHDDWLD